MTETIEKTSFHKAAETAYAEAGGNLDEAERLLRERIRADEDLMAQAAAAACRPKIQAFIEADRGRITRRAPHNPANRQDADGRDPRVQALGNAELWMDFPLRGGLRLRDADRSTLEEAAAGYEQQAKVLARRGRWLRRIAEAVPGDQLVGQALTNERIQRFWEETA